MFSTHPADPPLHFPAHRPVLMCRAYRCICIHLQPWQPGHCYCRAGSGRCRSQPGAARWPCGGRVSSPQHTGPLSPAPTAAAAATTREMERCVIWDDWIVHRYSSKCWFYSPSLFVLRHLESTEQTQPSSSTFPSSCPGQRAACSSALR